MSDRIIDVRGDGRASGIDRAVAALRGGQIVALPTDTVYGVAADAFSREGTRRIFEAKQRAWDVPLPILVRTPKQLVGICPRVPESAERLMAAYWPGALTLVITEQPGLSWNIGNSQRTVAVRMPLDDVALAVIRAVGPLAVTSANVSGRPPATTAAEAAEQLGEHVSVVLDDGERTGGAPSTIVDLTRDEPEILRAGDLDPDDVLAVARGELDPIAASARVAGGDADRTGDGEPDGR
ncbi:MAG: L-threonylcarbamoyladenylate synthase [Nitriliruptoraceae bacterium]